MISELNEINSSEKLDDMEKHLLAQLNKMNLPAKTNERLEQLKENQYLMFITLIQEMRFTRGLVKQMAEALGEWPLQQEKN